MLDVEQSVGIFEPTTVISTYGSMFSVAHFVGVRIQGLWCHHVGFKYSVIIVKCALTTLEYVLEGLTAEDSQSRLQKE